MKGTYAFWFGIIGVFLFLAAAVLGGLQIAGYSHTSQLISESYAIGTPYGLQIRYVGFLPSGIFIAAFSFLAIKLLPKSTATQIGFLGLGIFYGVATVVVSFFPCDEGCNKELVDPSVSQLIHNLTGLLTYMVVPASLVILGIAASKWKNAKRVSFMGLICGLVSILFVGVLSDDLQSEFVGLYQRIIECSVLLWIGVCSFYFKSIYNAAKATTTFS